MLVLIVRIESTLVYVARAEAGLPVVEDSAAVAAPRGARMARLRRMLSFAPFFRAFVAIEFSFLALAAAIGDELTDGLGATRLLVAVLVPVAALIAVGPAGGDLELAAAAVSADRILPVLMRPAIAMWSALGLIGWTHVGYPAVAGLVARRRRPRPPLDDLRLPTVALVIAAHNERPVIERRLENALALDYPADRLTVVVSVDGSSDGTGQIAERFAGRGVEVIDNPRAGKVAAQNAAVRATSSEIVAFSDANSMWDPDALKRLVRPFADPDVGYVCGRLRLIDPETGRNLEGLYWRYELWLREQESRLGSITAGNGAIYAVRRSAFIELSPAHSHDIGLPFRLRRAGHALAVRAAGRGDGAGSAVDVGRVGAQGADALPVLVRRAARRDAGPARVADRLLRRARLAPAAAVCDRPAARACCSSPRWRRRDATVAGGPSSPPMPVGWRWRSPGGRTARLGGSARSRGTTWWSRPLHQPGWRG